MKIDVINYRDDSDGGAKIELDLDEEATKYLIDKGFNSLLRDAIKIMEKVNIENERKTD